MAFVFNAGVWIKHLKPVIIEQMVKPSVLCNKLLFSSIRSFGKCSPYIIEARFGDCTTFCIEWNVIWTQSNSFVGSYTFNVINFSWSASHWEGNPDASIFIFMKVSIYCAKSPPSSVLGLYLVIVSYGTPHTPSTMYIQSALRAFCNSTDTQVPERDRSPTDYLHIDWFSVSAQFLHNTNVTCSFIWDGSSGMCNPLGGGNTLHFTRPSIITSIPNFLRPGPIRHRGWPMG